MLTLFIFIAITALLGFFWGLRELRQKDKKAISKIEEIGKDANKKIQ